MTANYRKIADRLTRISYSDNHAVRELQRLAVHIMTVEDLARQLRTEQEKVKTMFDNLDGHINTMPDGFQKMAVRDTNEEYEKVQI